MRMNNPDDQEYAARVVSDQFRSLINLLPSMKPGEGFIIGDSVLMPMRTLIDMPPKVPQSANVDFFGLWSSGGKGCNVDRVVDRWWRQERSATALTDARVAEEHQQPAARSAEPMRAASARRATPTVAPDEQNQVSPPEPVNPPAPLKPAQPVVEAPGPVAEAAASPTPAEGESARPKSPAEQKLAQLAAILGGGKVAE